MTGSLDAVIARIVSAVAPDRIILFGSRAQGTAAADSDYDLCIIKGNVEHRRNLERQIYRLLYGLGVAVDVVVETPERFMTMRENPFLIYHDIDRQGVVVYNQPEAS